jgi:hypothetical protein
MPWETTDRFAPLIEEAAAAMRQDPDPRWHAVADLLEGGPLGYAHLVDIRDNPAQFATRYPDLGRGVAVARAYLNQNG